MRAERAAQYSTDTERYSIWCKECELWLVKRRSGNKAKRVADQHLRTTGHEMEGMADDEG